MTIYAPMIYTAPCVMFLMWAGTLRGQVGGGWAMQGNLEFFGTLRYLKKIDGRHGTKQVSNLCYLPYPRKYPSKHYL
jgi:hypothetical protein